MKSFLKTLLAVICGLAVFTVIMFVILFGALGSMAALGSSTPVIPSSGVLKVDMSEIVLTEQTRESSPLESLASSSNTVNVGLLDAVRALDKAATDPAVKYIYLRTDGSASDLAAIEEFRTALADFRETGGKSVVAYMESPTSADYYLASVADRIYMTSHPGATTMLTGVGSQMMFLGDLFNRLGVNMQLIRHGKYKSAGEMYTRSSSSPENREQYQRMVDSIWETLSAEIAQSRDISVDELNALIDGLKLVGPEDFLEGKLVDELVTFEELKEKLAMLAVEDDFKDVTMIPFTDYVTVHGKPIVKTTDEIAVIYADGQIIDGDDKTDVAGDRFAGEIAKVRKDDNVKAVVLRVNSPGGSVIASDKIRRELDLLKAEKPLVASYGAYAASGGYWISSACDKIFTDATTLTGSIGVFGLIPDLSGAFRNVLHVNVESVTSNRHGDMYTGMRPFDSAEYAYMQASIEDIYDRFTTIVSEGRDIPKADVDAIGQGRVWTGADALGIRLADEIGTLEDAIAYAAGLAGNADPSAWKVVGYPKPLTAMEQMMELISGTSAKAVEAEDLGSAAADFVRSFTGTEKPGVYAMMDCAVRVQ